MPAMNYVVSVGATRLLSIMWAGHVVALLCYRRDLLGADVRGGEVMG